MKFFKNIFWKYFQNFCLLSYSKFKYFQPQIICMKIFIKWKIQQMYIKICFYKQETIKMKINFLKAFFCYLGHISVKCLANSMILDIFQYPRWWAFQNFVFLLILWPWNPRGGGNWPIGDLKGYIFGTECQIHLKPGCRIKF